MRYFALPLAAFVPLFAAITTAQQLIPSNLPACAGQCTVLQQAQTGCTPAGGAPETGESTYQSCFCQSALLTSLYTGSAVQLCSTCSQSDMGTIQDWYKNYCGRGGAPLQGSGNTNANQNQDTGQNQNGQQRPASTTAAQRPTTSATGTTSNQGVSKSADEDQGPWMSTHWRWVVMLIVIFLGLIAIAIGGWFFHRRYHRKREAQWALAPAMQPDITTWGPGQSVHDLGFTAGGVENEKGKSREQVTSVQKPLPAGRGGKTKEERRSGRFF